MAAKLALPLLALVLALVLAAHYFGALPAFALGVLLALLCAAAAAQVVRRNVGALALRLGEITRGQKGAESTARRARHARALQPAVRAAFALGAEMQARIAEARAQHNRLNAVLHGMAEGVLVVDAAGRTLLANPRLREIFNCWGDVEGRTPLELVRRAEVADALQRAASAEQPVFAPVALAGGRHLEMHAARFPAQGALQGAVAVFHDVTELRRLELMRREFVANVSHELRTPLTAIRGFAETLLEAGAQNGAEQRTKQLQIILRHSERLQALIEDLLQLSRIESGGAPLEIAPLDCAVLCRAVLRDLAPRFAARNITVELHAGENTIPRVLADRRALEQVLVNLLDNALKYTEAGGNVNVRLRLESARVRLEVADTGMGIPPADLARVFERFYRVDKARSRDLGGTGLGLAIVKHLVQAMDGEVFVQSTLGEGTTFVLLLPAAAGAAADASSASSAGK